MLLGLAHRVCHHVKQSLLYICFFSIDLFHCIKSNVLSRRLPILLWLFVTFIIFHFPIGKKLWGGPSPKTPTELMIVLQRFLKPHFFSSDEKPSFLCPAQAIPVGNMFSFNRCTLGVACKEEEWSFCVIFMCQPKLFKPTQNIPGLMSLSNGGVLSLAWNIMLIIMINKTK